MEILTLLALAFGVAGCWIGAVALARVRALESGKQALPAFSGESSSIEAPSSMSGFKIGIAISQDHKSPTFARMLQRELVALDVAAVVTEPSPADIWIRGSVTCNGYADVYWDCELSAADEAGLIFELALKPTHGDRQANLAIEVAGQLNRELRTRRVRLDRQKALGELGS